MPNGPMMKALHRPSICLGLIPLLFLSASSTLLAQRTIVATQSVGTPVVIQGGTLPPGAVVVPPGGPGQPPGVSAPGGPQPGGQPPAMGPDGKPIPPGGANPPGGKSPEGQGTGGPSEPIKRTSKPPEPPNKKEFEVRPDEKGMVQFQFRNQSWPDLLRWLAETSNLSLDWQELPNDYLNIATQRKQSLEETRDQFNRHLLARGFTMLELDGMIQVVKTAGINVSLVPKVPPDALESLPPNRFVRTSFTLTTLIAKEAAVEFKPLVSSNGTLNPLESTNRLEAMDSAGNLLEIYRILQEEQSEEAQESLAREFELEFVRANDAREQIISFLGLENKTNRAASGRMSQQELMMQQQEMQMRMQQQQMQQQQGGKPPAAAANNEIYVVANVRRNSVIAHAPPDKMAIISAFLKRIDVPNENSASLQSIETRMKIYRLMSLDPKQFVTSMMAMDALEPTTKLEVDEKNRAIIAYASLSDQLIIQQTLDRLDGSARDFEVIQLRRLRAEDVAGTIKFLMGKEEPKQDDRNRRMFFDPFGGFSRPQEPTNDDSFRVGANSQDNQLLLWANEVEIKEVNKLLVKLGEIPPQGLQRSRVRTIDASRSPETKEYLKRLQEAWSKVSPNPLVLPEDTEFETKDAVNMPPEPTSDSKGTETAKGTETDSEKASEAPAEKEGSEEKGAKKSNADVTRSERQSSEVPGGRLSLHQDGSDNPTPADVKKNSGDEAAGSKGASTTAETSPADAIRLQFDERGNLILTGDDLDALDRLEQMMLANAPPLKRYEVFYIQNARPSWVELNLKDYFKDEEQEQDSNPFAFIFGFDPGTTRKSEDPQLGKKRQLRFISDIDTRSIIVIGADEQQLKTIRSLIKLWDVPEKTNRQKLRFTKLVRIEHSRAESIVEAIKDAYRDLLSTNDKAFSKGAGGNKESKHEESTETVSDSGGLNFSFTGRLSMGIDRVTNSVIVSAEGEDLLKLVIEMIKELDQAAQPSGAVQMIQLGGTNSEAMERALKALISPKDDKRAPQQPGMEGQQPPNMPNQFQPPESQGNAKGRSRRNG